jgi:hypothetical protein
MILCGWLLYRLNQVISVLVAILAFVAWIVVLGPSFHLPAQGAWKQCARASGDSQIAERLGLSAERVRQLEHRALGKLRAAATGEPARPSSRP